MDELLGAAPCGFLSLSCDGTILQANETLAKWLDTEPAQMLEASIKSILSIGGRIFFETHFWPQLQLQGEIEEIYFSLRAPNGRAVPVLANAVRRERDGMEVYDCIFLRMSQRDRYESELILARKEAEKGNQAKADFLSMMSHELRTPLNAIIGFTEILFSEAHGPLTSRQQEDLHHIEKGGDDLLQILSDVLTFAEMNEANSVKMDVIDVGDSISRAVALVLPELEEAGLSYKSQMPNGPILVQADPNRVRQIVVSLLRNAIHFTPKGGTVLVNCSHAPHQIFIQIGDTGHGIPRDQLDRIFEPFVQIASSQFEAKSPGIGLGLAICRKMARSMGGDITVSSTVGIGSIFTLSLSKYKPPSLP